ncbi:hypothetical protein [Helicobacter enhydrae]|nr:hypothetical protein [Helicobacter enhydrae]
MSTLVTRAFVCKITALVYIVLYCQRYDNDVSNEIEICPIISI